MLKERGKVFCATILSGSAAGEKCIYTQDEMHGKPLWKEILPELRRVEQTEVVSIGKREIFVELFQEASRLVILGAGHVSQPVCQIGKILGFDITVVDDREEFVTRDRFPWADRLLCCDFDCLPEEIFGYENTFYVAVTRGHQGDRACARRVLSHPHAYFGMIGSRTKVKITKDALLEEGFSAEKVESMHSPIGLPLGGQLPEEIAVSIMAEIVKEKNRRYTGFADMDVANAVLGGEHGVMLTILSKSGSSPRGTGSKMFLGEGGTSYGSIGGGSIEFTDIEMKIHMILLAAGFGSRFGSNKLLYEMGGKPMYRHTLDVMLSLAREMKDADVTVVTRYEEIYRDAKETGALCLMNRHSEQGISSSVQIGLEANLHPGKDAYYLFFTADQPELKKETVRRFLSAFLRTGKGIGCLSENGVPKNPCVFHSCYTKELLSIQGDRGGKQVVKSHPEDVFLFEAGWQELRDIDTLDQLKN